MSATIDEKVVEMRFDNKNFESNVGTTLSTLDKLKQKLNLSGASKGLESIQTAANNCNMSGLSSSIDTVQAKFSALQVMGVTALANITNSAINAGKNLVSALTVTPVIDGFNEYETQINAIQTILANTKKEGTNVDTVNAALDTLNAYADKTIYNFTEMTRNIGTFTAAGVGLQTSVDSIQGIANLAAVSGSTSQQASTAMYQLSQAIASGTVKLMDWNSVVNAGMGGQVFQDALIRTSEHLQTGAKAAIAAKGSFRESLQEGWLTTDVLTETLKQFSLNVDTAEDYEKAMQDLVSQGYTQEEAKNIVDMAKTAGEAATKVKTFSQLIDTLKEALGSGWTQTWRTVVGDFDEAKELFTGISEFLSGIINASADARNALLESALGQGFSDLSEKFSGILEPAKQAMDTVQNVSESIADLGTVVDDVILGKFGDGEDRFNALTEAGQNYYEVQNKVNETLGNSFRYTDEQIAAQNELLGAQQQSTDATSQAGGETQKLTDAQKEQIKQLAKLSDEQLKAKGYTDEQIAAFDELRKTAEKLGMPLDAFVDKMDEINGRWLLINSFKNIGQSIVKIFTAIGNAFREIFEPIKPEQLFNAIAAFHKFTSSLVMSDETADKLKRTLKGVFAIINIITTFTGGALSTGFKVLSKVLSMFDLDILSVTASIGDMLVGFRDWILNNDLITNSLEFLVQGIKFVIDKIKEWYTAFTKIPQVREFIERVRTAISDLSKAFGEAVDSFKNGGISIKDILSNLRTSISNTFSNLFDDLSFDSVLQVLSIVGDKIRNFLSDLNFYDIGSNIVAGLVNGLKDGSSKVIEEIVLVGSKLLEAFKALLGIHSPSKEFYEIGTNIIQGLINGLKSMLDPLLGFVKAIGQSIIDVFNGIDFGVVLTSIVGVGTFAVFYKFATALESFGEAAKNITSPLKSIAGVFNQLKLTISDLGKAVSTRIKMESLKSLAISIAILAGSIFLLAQLDIGKAWNAVGVILALSAILGVLSIALTKYGGKITEFDSAKLAGVLLSVGGALLLLAATMKIISGMSWVDLGKVGVTILGLAAIIGGLVLVTKKGGNEHQIEQATAMIKKIGVALLVLAVVAKLIAGMSWGDMGKAGLGIAFLAVVVGGLMAVTKKINDKRSINDVGPTLLKVAGAMALLAIVAKLIAGMSWEAMGKAALGIGFLTTIIVGLMAATKKINNKRGLNDVGSTLIKVAGAMAILAMTAKIMAGMDVKAMIKGLGGITVLGIIVAGLIYVTRYAGGNDLKGVGVTLLAMAGAIAILAGICVILGLVKTETLARGIVAVGMLGIIVSLMVAATKNAKDVKGTMIGIAIAIGVMTGALVILSMIKPAALFKAVVALSAVMGMFAIIEKMSGSVTESFKTLIALTIAIGLIGGVLAVLSILPADQSIQNAIAISAVLLALAGSCKILNGVGEISKSALKSLGVLTAVTAGVAVILGIMDALNVQASLSNAAALSIMLLSMSGACAILGSIVYVSKSAMIAIGILTGVVAAVAVILGIMDSLDIKASLPNAISLSFMLLAMSGAVAILSAIGPLAASAIAGATSLVAVAGILTAAVAVFGAISKIPGVDWLVGEGGNFLQSVGTAIGQFVGGIVSGVADGVTSTLPQVATNLSEFMTNIQPFIDGAQNIDPSVMEGVKALADTILILTGADLLDALTSWITGGSSLTDFANQLVPFGNAMMQYSSSVSGIDAEAITASATAAKGLAEVVNAIPASGGLWEMIAGGKDLGQFASYLLPFGEGMKSYADSVSGINTEAITASATAANGLAEVANAIPASGGLWEMIAGGKDLGQFASYLTTFGNGMKAYAESVTGIDSGAITSSVGAAKGLVDIADAIPSSGGLWEMIAGGQDLGTFSAQLVKLGNGMSAYSNAVSGVDIGAISSSIACANRFRDLAQTLVDFDYSGIEGFNIKSLGDKLRSYSESVSGIDQDGVSNSIYTIRRLISLIGSMVGIDASGIDSFKSAVTELSTVNLGSIVDNFNNAIPQFTSIGSNLINALVGGMNSASSSMTFVVIGLMNSLLSGVQSAQARCVAIGVSIVQGLAYGMASGSGFVMSILSALLSGLVAQAQGHVSQFQTIGMLLMMNFKMGLSSGLNGVSTAIQSALSSCVGAIRSYRSSFAGAGRDLGQGLINGIASKQQAAYNAGFALGRKAVQGEKAGQQSHSPSRLTIKAGKWLGEGLVIGMDRMGKAVYNAGKSMGSGAVGGISKALDSARTLTSNISDVTPSISPVVDMSSMDYQMAELRLGANLGSLVSQPVNSLAGIVSNAQAKIDASNAEVVSAVNGLRDDLSTMYESDDQEIALYVDAKKLASSIAKPMNRQLNLISKMEGGL